MATTLQVCLQGHQWNAAAGEDSRCPTCGAPSIHGAGEGTADFTATPPPSGVSAATHQVDVVAGSDAARIGETLDFTAASHPTPAIPKVDPHAFTLDQLPHTRADEDPAFAATLDPGNAPSAAQAGKTVQPGGREATHRPDAVLHVTNKKSRELPQIPDMPGYEILGVLGRGGMGVVYKARDVKLNRLVALKMILAGAHAGTVELTRFQIEAEAIARLQHPNIVQVYEVGEQEGLPFMALEYVDGGSLYQQMKGDPFSPRSAAQVIATLARAMNFAHQHGIVHRDLKPANVLLRRKSRAPNTNIQSGSLPALPPLSVSELRIEDLEPKVTDFGLAKRLEVDQHQTGTGAILGTPTYMAPEQAKGQTKDVGPAADIYALGAILYDLLTGRPPLKGETVLDTLLMVQVNEPLPVRQLQPKVPLDLETICLKCLQKEPNKRFATAGELADDLERFLTGQPILSRPTPTWERVWKWTKRRPAAAAVLALSALMVLGLMFGGFFVARVEAGLRSEVERERDEVKKQKERGDKHLQNAFDAGDTLLARVPQLRLAKVAGSEELRRDLLQEAQAFYQGFLKAENDAPSVRWQIALAHHRLGDIQEQLGDYPSADEAYQAAVSQFNRLAEERYKENDVRYALAGTLGNRAVVLHAQQRRPEAEKSYQEALTLLEGLAKESPGEARYQRSLGNHFNGWGNFIQLDPQRHKHASSAFKQAIGHLEPLAKGRPHDLQLALELTRAQGNLGQQLVTEGSKDAEMILAETLARQDELLKRFGDEPALLKEKGRTLINLGLAREQAAQTEQAVKAYLDAAALLRQLRDDAPKVPDYRHQLAQAWTNLGRLLETNGEIEKAEEFRVQARQEWAKLAEMVKDSPVYRQELGRSHNDRAKYLAFKKDFDKAAEAVGDALAIQKLLAADFQAEPEYRVDLAQSHIDLGNLHNELGVKDREEQEYAEALKILDAAKAIGGDRLPRWRKVRIGANQNLVAVLLESNRPELAAPALEALVSDQEKLLASSAASAAEQQQLAMFGLQWLDVLVQLKDHAAVSAAAPRVQAALKAAPAIKTKEGRDEVRAAGALAQCVRLVEASDLPEEKQKELARRYGDQAIEFLQAAMARGFRDLPALRESAALAPIRDRVEFKKLVGS